MLAARGLVAWPGQKPIEAVAGQGSGIRAGSAVRTRPRYHPQVVVGPARGGAINPAVGRGRLHPSTTQPFTLPSPTADGLRLGYDLRPMSPSGAIDVHTHVLPLAVIELLRRDGRFGVTISEDMVWRGGSHPQVKLRPELVEPAAKIAEMDSTGVRISIVSPFVGLFFYGLDLTLAGAACGQSNQALAEFCAHDRDRLRWMATVPLQDPTAAALALSGAAALGCVGVEIGASVAGRQLDDPLLEPFWSAAEHHSLPVFIHSVSDSLPPPSSLDRYHLNNVIGNLLQTTVAAERLICSGTLDRHPDLRVLLAHGGGFFPYQAGRLRHALSVRPEMAGIAGDPWGYAGRLLFDSITHDPLALAYLVSRAGPENVLLGTDMPFDMGTTSPLVDISAAVGPEIAERIASRNARRLFRLDG